MLPIRLRCATDLHVPLVRAAVAATESANKE